MMNDFRISVNEDTESADDYFIDDADEYHIGIEFTFFFEDILATASDKLNNIPIFLRAGYWFNPDHNIKFRGTGEDDTSQSSRIIYSGGEDDHN